MSRLKGLDEMRRPGRTWRQRYFAAKAWYYRIPGGLRFCLRWAFWLALIGLALHAAGVPIEEKVSAWLSRTVAAWK